MTPSRRLVRAAFAHFLRRLRVILGPNVEGTCATCAFRPETDTWRGFDATAMALETAIREDKPFFCHTGMPYVRGVGWVPYMVEGGAGLVDLKRMTFCNGWRAIYGRPGVAEAFRLACDEPTFTWPDELGEIGRAHV